MNIEKNLSDLTQQEIDFIMGGCACFCETHSIPRRVPYGIAKDVVECGQTCAMHGLEFGSCK